MSITCLTLGVFTVLLFSNREFYFATEVFEKSDLAANAILIEEAKQGRALHGHYSRWQFRHPGPAFFYCYALAEIVLYERLAWVPSPYNAHAIAGLLLQTFFFSCALGIFSQWVEKRAFLPLALLFGVLHFWQAKDTFHSIWPPHTLLMPFLCFMVASASGAAGKAKHFIIAAISGSFLVHGYVAQPLFVVPLFVLAYLKYAAASGEGGGFIERITSRYHKDRLAHYASLFVALVFAAPLIWDLSAGSESNFAAILEHLRTHSERPHTALQALIAFISYFAYPDDLHIQFDHPDFSFHSYFKAHWQQYLLWFLALLAILIPHQLSSKRNNGYGGKAFLRNVAATLVVVTGLTIVWGCIQTGPMYFFNGFFLYSIPYVLLLLVGWAISVNFASINEKILSYGLYGVAVLLPYLVDVPNSYFAIPDDVVTFRAIERHVEDQAHKSAPRFLAFKEHDWAQAASVALALKRLGVEFRVDPNWLFLFGRRHSLNPEIRPGMPKNLEIWSIKRDSKRLHRNLDLSNGYSIEIGLPPLDPTGSEIVFNSELVLDDCLFFGFGFPITDDFCFTTSRHASLVLNRAITEIDPKVIISGSVEEQRLKVVLNGTEVYRTTFRGEETVEFSIPRGLWNQSATIFLAFVLPDAVSPKSHGQSDDTRRLGLGFRKIIIDTERPSHDSKENTAYLKRK